MCSQLFNRKSDCYLFDLFLKMFMYSVICTSGLINLWLRIYTKCLCTLLKRFEKRYYKLYLISFIMRLKLKNLKIFRCLIKLFLNSLSHIQKAFEYIICAILLSLNILNKTLEFSVYIIILQYSEIFISLRWDINNNNK